MYTNYSQETSACFATCAESSASAPDYGSATTLRSFSAPLHPLVSPFSSKTPTKYCLKLSNNHSCTDDISQLFFKSLLDSKILTGSSINSSYSAISFYASSVVKLKDWLLACGSGGSGGSCGANRMSYNSAIHLIYSLSKQQKYLENNKLGFVCFNVDDIVVIDDSKFICVNPSLCEEIFRTPSASSGVMTLCRPFNRAHCFCSPELLRMDSLPASVHYKTSYYSLGLLAVFCLFGYDGRTPSAASGNYGVQSLTFDTLRSVYGSQHCSSDLQQVYVSLQPILHTKLYFYLLRCLSLHAENRHLFFV